MIFSTRTNDKLYPALGLACSATAVHTKGREVSGYWCKMSSATLTSKATSPASLCPTHPSPPNIPLPHTSPSPSHPSPPHIPIPHPSDPHARAHARVSPSQTPPVARVNLTGCARWRTKESLLLLSSLPLKWRVGDVGKTVGVHSFISRASPSSWYKESNSIC